MTTRSARWIVFAAILLACGLRIVLMIRFAQPTHPELWEFGTIADNLVATHVYSFITPGVPTAYMPPGYPILIACLYGLFGKGPAAHITLGAILLACAIAIPFLIAAIARRIWGVRAATIALGLSLFWPQLLLISGRYHSLPISMTLMLAALLLLMRDRASILARAGSIGLLLGLYGNFRMELAAVLVPFLYALWALAAETRPPTHWPARLGACALMTTACLVGVTPWIVRNYQVFGGLVLGTSGGYNLLRGHNELASGAGRESAEGSEGTPSDIPARIRAAAPEWRSPETEIAADRIYRSEAIAYARANPMAEIRLTIRKFVYFTVTDFTHPVQRQPLVWIPSLVALGVGFGSWIRRGRRDPRQQVLWLMFAVAGALAIIFFVLPRYRIAVEFVPLLFFSQWLATVIGASRRFGPALDTLGSVVPAAR